MQVKSCLPMDNTQTTAEESKSKGETAKPSSFESCSRPQAAEASVALRMPLHEAFPLK